MTDLLPCPFCGADADFVDGEDDDGEFVPTSALALCRALFAALEER